MTLRDRFEARYPCPECAAWDGGEYRMTVMKYPDDMLTFIEHCARWEAYQAAMEDAVPEGWVVVPIDPDDGEWPGLMDKAMDYHYGWVGFADRFEIGEAARAVNLAARVLKAENNE